jgi:hypothetical protein
MTVFFSSLNLFELVSVGEVTGMVWWFSTVLL